VVAEPREPANSPDLEATAGAFQVLGLPRRLRILQLFTRVDGTLCGCELADVLELEDYQVSRDLSALRKAGLVQAGARRGTWVHYRLPEDPQPGVAPVLELVAALPLDPVDGARLELRLDFRERAGTVLGVGDPDVLAALDGIATSRRLTVLP